MIKPVSWEVLMAQYRRTLKKKIGVYPETPEDFDALLACSINTVIASLQRRIKSLEFKVKALSYRQSIEEATSTLTDETLKAQLRKKRNTK